MRLQEQPTPREKVKKKPSHNRRVQMTEQCNDVVNAADDALPPLGSMCLSEVIFSADSH